MHDTDSPELQREPESQREPELPTPETTPASPTDLANEVLQDEMESIHAIGEDQ